MALSIRERLLQAEESFLSTLSASSKPFSEEFERTWNALADDIMEAANAGQMSQEDLTLADAIASRVALLCESFEDLAKACDEINISFERDLEQILEEHGQSLDADQSRSYKEVPQIQSTIAPYINQAYTWLKRNLSNPYPSREMREAIARDTGSNPRHIEGWFGDVRKRIGWNGIRKRYFNNKRRITVEAATAYFNDQLSDLLNESVRHDFAKMSAAAEELYAGKFSQSELDICVEEFSSKSPHHSRHPSPAQRQLSTERDEAYAQDGPSSRCLDMNHKRRRSPSHTDISVCRKRARCDSGQPSSYSFKCRGLLRPMPRATSPALRDLNSKKTPDSLSGEKGQLSGSETHLVPEFQAHQISLVANSFSSTTHTDRSRNHVPSKPQELSSPSPTASGAPASNPVALDGTLYCSTSHPWPAALPSSVQSIIASEVSQEALSQLSFEFPESVTCDTPDTTQAIDLVFYDLARTGAEVLRPDCGHSLFPTSTTHNDPADPRHLPSVPPAHLSDSESSQDYLSTNHDIDTTSWANYFLGDSGHEPVPGQSNASLDLDVVPSLPPDPFVSGDLDFHLNQLFNLDTSTVSQNLEPFIDQLVSNVVGGNDYLASSLPFTPDATRTKLAQLEQLKKRRNRIQEHINSLETQIAATLVA